MWFRGLNLLVLKIFKLWHFSASRFSFQNTYFCRGWRANEVWAYGFQGWALHNCMVYENTGKTPVLKGDQLQIRCVPCWYRFGEAEDVTILKGVFQRSRPYALGVPSILSVSGLVKKIERSKAHESFSRSFPGNLKTILGQTIFWAIGYGSGVTGEYNWWDGNDYLEHHRKPEDRDNSNFIIEQMNIGRLWVASASLNYGPFSP